MSFKSSARIGFDIAKMCLHPIHNDHDPSSVLNKITDEINEKFNDMDSLSEFAGFCRYLDSVNDLSQNLSDLKLLHLNIRSILGKQDELLKLLVTNKIDVCTVNETWLKKDNKHLLKMKGYSCITTERKACKGGGVGIIVSDSLIEGLTWKIAWMI